ncbi:hypothetical protein T484DRAFT_1809513 [Baffinella frigidus]|nr:hypothetical protein T484DRAFT_1809513 [Cryptophyta sp. CCMP2293]
MSSKREGVPGVKLPSVSSQKAASGGGERRPTGEFSVAWEDSVDSHELEENADSGIPMELWNKVVSRHVPGPNPRLGGSMRNRSPMLNGSISRNSGSSRTRRDNLGDDVYKQLETLRPKSDLQQKIRESLGGYDPDKVARDAAEEGDADSLMEVLEATIVGVDMVLSEVVKQVQLACLERAELIDRCRKHFLAMFAHMATALFTSQAQLRGVHERGEGLEVTIGPLREEHKLAVQKIAALELELKSANERMVAMEAELDNTKRSVAKTREIEERGGVVTRGVAWMQVKVEEGAHPL